MMRRSLLLTLLISLSLGIAARSQAPPQCKIRFSVVRRDTLNNVQQGLVGNDLKWIQTKMAQKYSDICYVSPAPSVPVVFFISLSKDTYHGTRTVTDTHTTQGTMDGTVTDTTVGSGTYGQQVGTVSGTTQSATTTDREVPYSFPYTVLTLSVETPESDGTSKVRRNFQNNNLQYQVAGIGVTNRHPYHSLIEQAIEWIHNGGLSDAMQGVPASPQNSPAETRPIRASDTPSQNNTSSPTTLSVSSTPESADIELDGSFVGNTPSELSVAAGDHTLEIKKAGFETWERKLKTTSGSTIHINTELEKSPQ